MFSKIIAFIKNPKTIAFILGVLSTLAATTATQVDDKAVMLLQDILVTPQNTTTVTEVSSTLVVK
jgi:hypothetical protein